MEVCECSCKRQTYKLFDYGDSTYNVGSVFTHKSCVCNQKVALEQRHQVDDGSRYTTTRNLRKHLRPLVRRVDQVDEEVVIAHGTPIQRRLYLAAQETLLYKPLCKKDGYLKMFLKDDKYMISSPLADVLGYKADDSLSAPRCIQYRNKRYGLRLGTYLLPIEKHVYTVTDSIGSRVFAKGRNSMQRASDLRKKWDAFSRPKAYLLDHSKFDAHITTELLDLEHWYYKTCCPSKELDYLLKAQLINKGFTANGTSYVTKATRMSGDQNTGLGNSLINYALLKDVFDRCNIKAYFYVDGDDSVVICDKAAILDHTLFAEYGMKTKMETTDCFEQVEFCQCRPVLLQDDVYNMARNPMRLLLRLPWSTRPVAKRKLAAHLASVGRCEMAMGCGLPIGQFIGQSLSRLSTKYIITDSHNAAKLQRYHPQRVRVCEPSELTRLSYQEAWGICPELQRHIECIGITLKVSSVEDVEERPFVHNVV